MVGVRVQRRVVLLLIATFVIAGMYFALSFTSHENSSASKRQMEARDKSSSAAVTTGVPMKPFKLIKQDVSHVSRVRLCCESNYQRLLLSDIDSPKMYKVICYLIEISLYPRVRYSVNYLENELIRSVCY